MFSICRPNNLWVSGFCYVYQQTELTSEASEASEALSYEAISPNTLLLAPNKTIQLEEPLGNYLHVLDL